MKIKSIKARTELDSRGEWTIEVCLKLQNGVESVASVPQGKSRGRSEAVYVKPGIAIKNIEKVIAPKLRGIHAGNQNLIDHTLLKLDGTKQKSRLGGNSILGISLAVARAAALSERIPLWKHLRKLSCLKITKTQTPRLYVNVINGGLHAENNLDFQEYLIIPKSRNIKESVQIAKKFYGALKKYLEGHVKPGELGLGDEGGFSPHFRDNFEPFEILKKVRVKLAWQNKVDFGLDAAVSNVKISTLKLFAIYKRLKSEFNLYYLEDPFKENDFKNFAKLNKMIGKNTLICGDDLTTTNPKKMIIAQKEGSMNAVIVKPNQIGTVTETLEAIKLARKYRWKVVVSHRSGETQDDFIADLAYGVGADGFKLGAPRGGERIAKYNRLLEIGEK